ncbi:TipAS antibiotic-recognition domain-containing protein [Pseudokineococcus marinus]|uniref:MerR family transcriptional regulator n=1 Tax=Pseudokineococcus marinus TaxID=351215 RepID=A0A849BM34_9ACTN|nr:TipAS antibiotic-recognition domain-containing protein [Pseudokineococcus marinus]NNH23711.1 MerR family transcriptional regulator [Pseudokineococcus marinus]
MAWTTAEVARMSGTTARTLRHYDAVGLLVPAGTGAGGVRLYERAHLLRLQRILLLRELGVPLAVVGQVLAGQRDEAAALRAHADQLAAEGDRLARLAATARRTADHLEGDTDMTEQQFFEGLARDRDQYEQELVAQHGEGVRAAFAQARERTAGWSREDFERGGREHRELAGRLGALVRRGAAPGDEEVQALVAEHHAGVAAHWTPDRSAYRGLADTYVEDARFRSFYDDVEPGLAAWLREAMGVWADAHLT